MSYCPAATSTSSASRRRTSSGTRRRQLRYAVYCVECKYLDASQYPTQRETDEYDPHSIHFAATNERNEMVATLRLVRDSSLGFPLEQHAGTLSADYERLPARQDGRDLAPHPRQELPAPRQRRPLRSGARRSGEGRAAQAEATYRRSQYPLILFGLFKEMYLESVNMGLEYWVAAMESGLQRMLSRFGLGLHQVGEPMSYYGEVIPYYASIRQLEQFLMDSRPDVFQFFAPSPQS